MYLPNFILAALPYLPIFLVHTCADQEPAHPFCPLQVQYYRLRSSDE